jgi:hypothetical protein
MRMACRLMLARKMMGAENDAGDAAGADARADTAADTVESEIAESGDIDAESGTVAVADTDMESDEAIPVAMLQPARSYRPYVIGILGIAIVAVLAGTIIARKPEDVAEAPPLAPSETLVPDEPRPAEDIAPLSTENLHELAQAEERK